MIIYYKTARTYIFWATITLFFMPLCLLLSLLPERKRYNKIYYLVANQWNKYLVFFGCFCIKKNNEVENLPNFYTNPAIFVFNHSSSLDIPIAELVIGKYPHIWISKKSYGKIPFFGFLLKRMHTLIDKTNPRESLKELIKTYKLAEKHNLSIILFPEGTRSQNGSLQNFNSGFTMLAKKLNYPIIPISICGAHQIMKKNNFLINPRACDIKINIGKPITQSPAESEKELINRVEDWFKISLNQN